MHIGLAAELSFRSYLARHARYFRSESVELVHHGVDGVLQFQDLALHIHGDLLGKIAVGHRGRYFGDVAHLTGQIAGHQVHTVGQIFPGSGHAFHVSLTAEFSFRTDFARHARHFRSESVELVHHRVDGVFEFENLALSRRP